MNVQTKQGRFIFNVFNIARSDIGLSGHYQVVYDLISGDVYFRKFADYGGLTYVIKVKEENFLPADGETKQLFLKQFKKRLNCVNVTDLEDTFDSIRELYAKEEEILDKFC